jgi:diguanylate cyclase (GGDEF)-like protein
LRTCCREMDTCARLGGDEFAVILPHTDSEAAAVVRDRILDASAQTMVPVGEEAEVPISLSIGAATLSASEGHTQELIAAADAEMYRVKQVSRAERVPVPAR